MVNVFFELERLRIVLQSRGYDSAVIDERVERARADIRQAFMQHGTEAMSAAIDSGVAKQSADFINELILDEVNMKLTTESGNLDFSVPPYPNLANLLQGGKPIKDGSGVYKVIPLDTPSSKSRKLSANIYDAMKRAQVERAEAARAQYQKVIPGNSKGQARFRTATSKQNAGTQWVLPAQERNFAEDVTAINENLEVTMDAVIQDIIRTYEEAA